MIKILKHILITEKQNKKIKKLAEKLGSSEASIIRLAIDKLKM
jgi:DNA-binding MurR/RpiR family transcriptional regulator